MRRRRKVGLIRMNPDLQNMHELDRRAVALTVAHASTGVHALNGARAKGRCMPHRVFMRQFALQDVTDNFHVAVTVSTKTLARLHPVIIIHAKRAELNLLGIKVVRERERVKGPEPAVVGVAALCAPSQLQHRFIQSLLHCSPSAKHEAGRTDPAHKVVLVIDARRRIDFGRTQRHHQRQQVLFTRVRLAG